MTPEEKFLRAMEDDGEPIPFEPGAGPRQRLQKKNAGAIKEFLGQGKRSSAVGVQPKYYGDLLAWALRCHIEEDGWEVTRTLGYHEPEPRYSDVFTDCGKSENCLADGQLLLAKGKERLVITVDTRIGWRSSVLVEGQSRARTMVNAFLDSVMAITRERNFYRGKKIEFGGRLRFLDVRDRSWETIILDPETKREIRSNTVSFLRKTELWEKYGIPPRRGVILAGEPGTGKTVICKAIMAEADGITCITTSAYEMVENDYISEVYELAQDLSPCIVFIEDLDLIGQNRDESGYRGSPPMLALLAELDGVEQKKEIVTVATTNCLDALDKALSQRPSRFDRVVKMSLPSPEQRRTLVGLLSAKIPLDGATQDYIARKTEGCTPAQIQEVVYSLAIEHAEELSGDYRFSTNDVDRFIARIGGKNGHRLGFCAPYDNNGHRPDTVSINQEERS